LQHQDRLRGQAGQPTTKPTCRRLSFGRRRRPLSASDRRRNACRVSDPTSCSVCGWAVGTRKWFCGRPEALDSSRAGVLMDACGSLVSSLFAVAHIAIQHPARLRPRSDVGATVTGIMLRAPRLFGGGLLTPPKCTTEELFHVRRPLVGPVARSSDRPQVTANVWIFCIRSSSRFGFWQDLALALGGRRSCLHHWNRKRAFHSRSSESLTAPSLLERISKPEPNALASGGTTILADSSRPEASAYGSRDVVAEVLKYALSTP